MIVFLIRACRFKIHFSFFALLAFCCVFSGIEGGAFLFIAVFVHEFSHLAAMMILSMLPTEVTVSGLGCRIIISEKKKRLRYRENIFVSLSGPISNLIFAGFVFFLGDPHSFLFLANITMGVLHILPIEPLDGGLALHAFLCGRMKEKNAAAITFTASLIFLIPMAVLGFFLLLQSRYNFSLLALSIYLMLYLVLKRDFFST